VAPTEGEIVIDRPPEEVFDFVADERNVYDPRIVRVEKLTSGSIGPGTRFRTETRARGRTVPMTVEITTFKPPFQLASDTRLSSLEIISTATFEPVEARTRVRWHWEVRPRGALRLLAPIVDLMSLRQARIIWGSLKCTLEEG
jgi:hypothetical protein